MEHTAPQDLVVIAGLHLLEREPEEYYLGRFNKLQERLIKLPKTVPIHLELASVVRCYFSSFIIHLVTDMSIRAPLSS